MEGEDMEHGPVDVVVLAAGEPRFDGSVLAELERLSKDGTIRVLDAMVLLKDSEGTAYALDMEDLPAQEKAALGFIDTGTLGLFDSYDSDTLIEGMVPGSAVVALAVEHTWAVGLVNALAGAGVELAMQVRIPAPVVDEALAGL
jgi:hypothetical protein